MKRISDLSRSASATSRETRATALSNSGAFGSASLGIYGPPTPLASWWALSFAGSRPVSATIAASRAEEREAKRSIAASVVI